MTASRLLICDFHSTVIAGDGVPENTAFYIHGCLPPAGGAFHTHMPNATALTMVEGEPLIWAGQTAQTHHEGGWNSAKLPLESIKRQLDRDSPEYRQ